MPGLYNFSGRFGLSRRDLREILKTQKIKLYKQNINSGNRIKLEKPLSAACV